MFRRFDRINCAALALSATTMGFACIGSVSADPGFIHIASHSGPTVVACVGDSITAGVGASSGETNYPSLLGDLLGPAYKVINFGESGATLLKNGDSPYWKRGSFGNSANASPDIVVIMLGTNDSKPWNWKLKDQFAADYGALIDYYELMPSHPAIYSVLPPPVPGTGNYGINEANVDEELPIITNVASEKHTGIIDVHAGVPNSSADFVDNVHPNDTGYIALAGAVFQGLTGGPVIEPIAQRAISGPITVSIVDNDPSATIHYTIDSTAPNRKSPVYSAPITLPTTAMVSGAVQTAPIVVKAQAFHGRKSVGEISMATFTPMPSTAAP